MSNACNADVIACAAEEMYNLIVEFVRIDREKMYACAKKDGKTYLLKLIEYDEAVRKGKALIKRLGGEVPDNE